MHRFANAGITLLLIVLRHFAMVDRNGAAAYLFPCIWTLVMLPL